MVALSAVFLLFAFGLHWAHYRGYITLTPWPIRWPWLIFLALIPRLSLHLDYDLGPQLVSTQIIIFIFLIANYRLPGVWLLLSGLLANMIPTIANGGLMPVSAALMPYLYDGPWQIGERIAWSIILPAAEIRFYWLSDWVLIPVVGKAYSPGDFLTLAGGLWVLASMVSYQTNNHDG